MLLDLLPLSSRDPLQFFRHQNDDKAYIIFVVEKNLNLKKKKINPKKKIFSKITETNKIQRKKKKISNHPNDGN